MSTSSSSLIASLSSLVGFVVIIAGLLGLTPFLIMLLWGAIAADFGLATIGFWTAVKIHVLLAIAGYSYFK